MKNNQVIHVEKVGLRYGTGPEVLRDISFSLGEGDMRFLVGSSGAGKTSLLKLMYMALKPSRGIISLFGQDISQIPRYKLALLRRRTGVIFQNFRLLEHLSAFDNVALPLRVSGVKGVNIRKYVMELLEWVELQDYVDAFPATLSGGQQQRVAIARAIIARPRLLLADEPTGNVDDLMAMRLMYLFEELNKLGTSIVIATHNEMLVKKFGYRLLRLEQGRLTLASGLT